MPLFTGRFEYSIDDKGRLSVPARLREQVEVEGQESQLIATVLGEDFLRLYSPIEFSQLLNALAEQTDERSRNALRYAASDADTCPIDKQGRIMIPPHLRQRAGLRRDVVILGVVKRIEVWDREREAAHHAEVLQQGGIQRLSGLKVPGDLL